MESSRNFQLGIWSGCEPLFHNRMIQWVVDRFFQKGRRLLLLRMKKLFRWCWNIFFRTSGIMLRIFQQASHFWNMLLNFSRIIFWWMSDLLVHLMIDTAKHILESYDIPVVFLLHIQTILFCSELYISPPMGILPNHAGRRNCFALLKLAWLAINWKDFAWAWRTISYSFQ